VWFFSLVTRSFPSKTGPVSFFTLSVAASEASSLILCLFAYLFSSRLLTFTHLWYVLSGTSWAPFEFF